MQNELEKVFENLHKKSALLFSDKSVFNSNEPQVSSFMECKKSASRAPYPDLEMKRAFNIRNFYYGAS